MRGFKTASASSVELLVGKTSTFNFTLESGEVNDVIMVLEQVPMVLEQVPIVDATSTSVGSTFTPNEVQDLPLNGRDFGNLSFLAPGARPINSYDPTKNRVAVFSIDGSNRRNVTVNGSTTKTIPRDRAKVFPRRVRRGIPILIYELVENGLMVKAHPFTNSCKTIKTRNPSTLVQLSGEPALRMRFTPRARKKLCSG